MKENKRILFLDISKAIGIFIVVLGHYGYYLGIPFKNSVLWNMEHYITLFHMPLFFIISGLLHNNSSNNLKKLWVSLVRPYILLNIICIIIGAFGTFLIKDFDFSVIKRNLIGIISGGDFYGTLSFSGPLWFVYSLAFIKLYFSMGGINKYLNIFLIAISAIVMYKGNILPFRLDSTLVGYFFFTIGYYSKKMINLFLRLNLTYVFFLLVFSLLLLNIIAFYNLDFNNRQALSINAGFYGNYPILFFASGIIGTVFIFSLSRFLDVLYNNLIHFISDVCIIILATHQLLYFIYKIIINRISNNILIDYGYNVYFSFLSALIVFTLSCLVSYICKIYFPLLLGYRK